MFFQWLKRYLPRSLYGRAALILLVPILTLQIVISVSFVQRYYEDVTRQMTRSVILELEYLLQIADAAPDAVTAFRQAAAVGTPLGLTITLPAPETRADDSRDFYDLSGRAMIKTLHDSIPAIGPVDLSTPREVTLRIATSQGDMQVSFDRTRVSASNPHQLLVMIAVLGLLLMLIAYIFLRNQLRPIRQLALAATEYGKGRIQPYRPSGAAEVRTAGAAFLDMRNRIERQAQTRTLMLSGISHDLRTPLTRMRLGLSLIDDPEAEPLRRDLDDMQHMLDAFLDFIRADASDALEPTDTVALVEQVVSDARRAGQAATLLAVEGNNPGPVPLRPLAIRRALDNLIGNALRYGGQADLTLSFSERTIRISVEDDGPGIPPDQREEALKPFSRLDPARNQDLGSGVGLGLAIVADIARAHGGVLRLGDSAALGGLRADLVLAR
ncbi:MAG: ATP-binding protein [Rhodobacterales bacterium]|nr:ATP-binding protein [Rhodobacterales bacterium]